MCCCERENTWTPARAARLSAGRRKDTPRPTMNVASRWVRHSCARAFRYGACAVSLGWLGSFVAVRAAVEPANGGFESALAGWRPIYTREPQAGRITIETALVHSGQSAARIEHTGTKDWSFESSERLAVKPGDILELQAWVNLEGAGDVSLCVSTWDNDNVVVSWSFGAQPAQAKPGWQPLRCRFVIPAGVARVQPRVLGSGPGVVRLDDFTLERKTNLFAARPSDFPARLTVRNAALEVTLNTTDATLAVLDRRSQRRWSQKSMTADCILKTATAAGDRLELALFHAPTGLDVGVVLQLMPDEPEFTVALSGHGRLPSALVFPAPFTGEAGDYLVVPMNEGISYPVDDATIAPMRLIAYGGHGICMAFWGLTDGTKGHMAILETPDDVSIRIERLGQRLVIAPSWEGQRAEFGYERRLRYVFFEHGGHVAMAKRYRAYAQELGLLKTLEEKRRTVPAVDRLLGAVNVWYWEKDAVAMVKELKSAGIDRILWSNRQGPEGITAMNALGVLTSRYDIYQDVMDPANFSRLRSIHSDWTTAAWPQDIMLDRTGNWIKGWAVTAKDGTMLPCGVLCDRRAVEYARERVPADLAIHPYLGRFIDTTTASPWRECYSPEHPMTRTESKEWKMALLRYMSDAARMVTGCETGHDASVPYLHFYEGMMSLGPYRIPDAGRRMQQIVTDVPERVAKFQVGHTYRLPLWELVFHDCTVSYWYWGDYNNKLPALWDKRDLFNVLYGVPPMFMFTRAYWEENRARFVASYQNTCPIAQEVGMAEMTDHRFLTANRDVQQTTFANGISIIVNFGPAPHRLADGESIASMGYKVMRQRL